MVTVAELIGTHAKGYEEGADKLAELGQVEASRVARMAAADAQVACDAFVRSAARYTACLEALTEEEFERFCEAVDGMTGRSHAGKE